MYAIAIDGPAGAGKSSVAKAVAKELDIIYVDTGALYRAIGLCALENDISTTDRQAVSDMLKKIKVNISHKNGIQSVLLNGEDVNNRIRTPEVSMAASNVSAIPEVREFLLNTQRNIAKNNCVIMDGRDIASVVLPNAEVKIFLTASVNARADRRFFELNQMGIQKEYDQLLIEITTRDYNDTNRDIAPLKPAEDSIIVDTTYMTFDESVEAVLNIITDILAE